MEKALRERFAEFIINTHYEDLPDKVIHQAKRCILDLLGVALAGRSVGLAVPLIEIICAMEGKEEATIIGDGRKFATLDAAFVNGVSGHALDMDDGHRYASAHPGVIVIPAALATGEKESSSGKAWIEAVVIGYETLIGIAAAMNPSHAQKGFHTTGTVGPFGAAAASSKLLGLGKPEVENALAIAGLQGAGLLEVTTSGQMMKPLHSGKAVQAGVLAALLAQKGCDGPELIFEGEKGFFKAFTDGIDHKPFSNLASRFEIMNTYFKLHATCRGTHASIDAALEIINNHGIHPENIKGIEIETFPHAIKLCGYIVHPENVLGAKFSIPFSVAMAIILGDLSADKFTEENIKNESIKELASKVKVSVGKEWERSYPEKRGASVTIKTYSGQSFSFILPLAKGSPENPASLQDLIKKFQTNVSHILSKEKSNKLEAAIMDLENRSVRDITRLIY